MAYAESRKSSPLGIISFFHCDTHQIERTNQTVHLISMIELYEERRIFSDLTHAGTGYLPQQT